MSLSSYTKKSFNEDIYMPVNGKQLLLEHGKDIDSILYKYSLFANNVLNNNVNESVYNIEFTIPEQETSKNLLKYICEDYYFTLKSELSVYENIYYDTIDEGLGDVFKKAKEIIQTSASKGKDWVAKQIKNLKIKIKEVKEFLLELANDAIKSVKDMTDKLMSILEKLDCTIKDLFDKIGFDTNKLEDSWNSDAENVAKQLKDNPKIIDKLAVYESYANEMNLILEESDDYDETDEPDESNESDDDTSQTVNQNPQKKTWKQMLWSAFKQLAIWATVCVIIPGTVVAFFPGTFLALLVPLACKLAWSGYKIFRIWKQFKIVKNEWKTYNKLQKWISAGSMVFGIIAIAFNIDSLVSDGGTVIKAFAKTGGELMAKAELGISPDVLTKGWAAMVKMISNGKVGVDDFSAAYKEISDSFAQHFSTSFTQVVTAAAKKGQSAEEFLKNTDYKNLDFKKSMKVWDWLKKVTIDDSELDKVSDSSMVDMMLDGNVKAKWMEKLAERAVEYQQQFGGSNHLIKAASGVNKMLNQINPNAGSITPVRMTAGFAKWMLKEHPQELGHNALHSILGITTNEVTRTITQDVLKAATDMLITIPSVEFSPQNDGGFRVRLGEKGSNNYIYEVGSDDVKTERKSKYKEQYEEIKKTIVTENVAYMKIILDASKKEDETEDDVHDKLQEFKEQFQENIDDGELVIVYGKRVNGTNESLVSLKDFVISEAEEDENDNENDEQSDEQEEKKVPVMMFIYGYGKDLADANDDGPREEAYTMKGLFNVCEFFETKEGTSKKNIAEMFGDILHYDISDLYDVIADKPCNKKFKLYKYKDNDVIRPELGELTNIEVAELLSNSKYGAKLVKDGGKVSAAETPEERKQLKQLKKTNRETIEEDEEVQETIKEINPDFVDEEGNIDEEELERTNNVLSEYQLCKHKEKQQQGFFSRIWTAIKNFFSGNGNRHDKYRYRHQYTEKELEKIADIIYEKVKKKTNESLEDLLFTVKQTSLSNYVLEKLNEKH